jgi:hypothetical protein
VIIYLSDHNDKRTIVDEHERAKDRQVKDLYTHARINGTSVPTLPPFTPPPSSDQPATMPATAPVISLTANVEVQAAPRSGLFRFIPADGRLPFRRSSPSKRRQRTAATYHICRATAFEIVRRTWTPLLLSGDRLSLPVTVVPRGSHFNY